MLIWHSLKRFANYVIIYCYLGNPDWFVHLFFFVLFFLTSNYVSFFFFLFQVKTGLSQQKHYDIDYFVADRDTAVLWLSAVVLIQTYCDFQWLWWYRHVVAFGGCTDTNMLWISTVWLLWIKPVKSQIGPRGRLSSGPNTSFKFHIILSLTRKEIQPSEFRHPASIA